MREYRHVSTLLARESSDLSDQERLELARRVTELAPRQPDSWWAVATHIVWMLRELDGEELRSHPLFPELIAAWNTAIALDGTDAAAPYNKAAALSRADLVRDAYAAFMLAGQTEVAHPSTDIDWPAHWHFENAADSALACGDNELALLAAQAAIDAGAEDADAASLLEHLRIEGSDRLATNKRVERTAEAAD